MGNFYTSRRLQTNIILIVQSFLAIPAFVVTARELWPKSKTKSLEMTSKLCIPASVTSNPEVVLPAINIDVQPCSERT